MTILRQVRDRFGAIARSFAGMITRVNNVFRCSSQEYEKNLLEDASRERENYGKNTH